MPSTPLITQRLKDKAVWSGTRRRRARERALVEADPSKAPATVTDGAPPPQSGA